eukprot:TRINITY_DN10991_c0_g1_i1.p1 TRINITY_DN10991_c0_g1~~TRINITY_DN10991_c0_g1_i1.p1  ORF type:complete len:100 (+),score=11.56 TRINITY_DN10991_c0_g1_i1:102-401(+)
MSLTTEQNARFAFEELSKKAERSQFKVIVSTCAYHVYRCERIFSKYFHGPRVIGVDSVTLHSASLHPPHPSELAVIWVRIHGALREVGAIVKNWILGHM